MNLIGITFQKKNQETRYPPARHRQEFLVEICRHSDLAPLHFPCYSHHYSALLPLSYLHSLHWILKRLLFDSLRTVLCSNIIQRYLFLIVFTILSSMPHPCSFLTAPCKTQCFQLFFVGVWIEAPNPTVDNLYRHVKAYNFIQNILKMLVFFIGIRFDRLTVFPCLKWKISGHIRYWFPAWFQHFRFRCRDGTSSTTPFIYLKIGNKKRQFNDLSRSWSLNHIYSRVGFATSFYFQEPSTNWLSKFYIFFVISLYKISLYDIPSINIRFGL